MTETQDPLKHACRDLDLIDNTLPLRDTPLVREGQTDPLWQIRQSVVAQQAEAISVRAHRVWEFHAINSRVVGLQRVVLCQISQD
jgi:hypothetical protein